MYDFSEVNEIRKQEKIEHLKKMQDVLLELRDMGLGYRNMAKRLNELGYRTCTGRNYTYATVFDDLKALLATNPWHSLTDPTGHSEALRR